MGFAKEFSLRDYTLHLLYNVFSCIRLDHNVCFVSDYVPDWLVRSFSMHIHSRAWTRGSPGYISVHPYCMKHHTRDFGRSVQYILPYCPATFRFCLVSFSLYKRASLLVHKHFVWADHKYCKCMKFPIFHSRRWKMVNKINSFCDFVLQRLHNVITNVP